MPFHPRNRHQGHYHFAKLTARNPALKPHLTRNPSGEQTIDFSDAAAVKELNRALLQTQYGLTTWDIPEGYLCPPVPGRADVIHAIADLLSTSHDGQLPPGTQLRGLDIGCGANLIYPLIGHAAYRWRFVASETDQMALDNARRILKANPDFLPAIEVRKQADPAQVFSGIIDAEERFDFSLCNPPFHADQATARAANQKKWQQLGKRENKSDPGLNFAGQSHELICPGGEAGFLQRLAADSKDFGEQVFWFTTLVSKAANLPALRQQLEKQGARDLRVIDMAQGNKHSRLLAWTYLDKKQRRAWRRKRWQPAE
ncbi:MAG: 23S rRNA (adenine(1618)-N(6))-methyltransferase RlmF [Pseudomonadaceae bacterium]|nr:MAG: 23S rRNA (adenine(1618)-N(6))-methyltransferase RlmF [Pseudomonadaceae bacterium]